ncbi:transketolase [Citrobacter freundii]|nr:transketolase [Citrobacter freundii]
MRNSQLIEMRIPDLAAEFTRRMSGGLPEEWEETTQKYITDLQANPVKIATP